MFEHNTNQLFGAAALIFTEKLYQFVWDYAPTFNSKKYVFYTTSPGRAMLPSSVAKQIAEAWKQGGSSKSFSCTKWRKSVVTAVSNYLTGDIVDFACIQLFYEWFPCHGLMIL